MNTTPELAAIREGSGGPALRATGLAMAYGVRRVLDDVSLTVQPGEVVAVMGPSGSGKSTLLHCLGGLLRPDIGSVHIAGTDVTSLQEPALTVFRRQHVGYVFQWHGLLPDLSARENVAIAAWANGSRKRVALQKSERLLTGLGLAAVTASDAQSLSGGEAQRVAVARALVNDPAVVLADEPTASLDRGSKFVVADLLRAAAQSGCAVVMATHDADVASTADRVVQVG